MRAGNCLCVLILALAGIASLPASDWVFTGNTPGKHREPVSALVYKGDIILSAGQDGFLEIWDAQKHSALERFQISPYRITAMAERPASDELCVLESDNLGLYRISAWNYRERRNIFTLQFRDPISHISYSMGGSFIIAARTGRSGLFFIDAGSGELLQTPPSLTGIVAFAATGRSERNMLVYLTSGVLSYWDLESGMETSRFDVPENLQSLVLFSNRRYIAGLHAEGLVIIHAASGETLAWDDSVSGGSLLCAAGDDFFCLIQNEDTSIELNRFTVDRDGLLVTLGISGLSGNDGRRFTTIAANGTGTAVVLGTTDGTLVLAGTDGRLRPFTIQDQIHITEAAVSGSLIAFLAEDSTVGFIPLDYRQFSARTILRRERNEEAYNRVTAFDGEHNNTGHFIFWQDRNTRIQPVIRSSNADDQRPIAARTYHRSPIRSAHSFGGKIILLDSTGNLSVLSPFDTETSAPFTFFSIGLMDAAFVDQDRIILGRSAISGNTPFLKINIHTGETVPLPYPSQAGVILHRGSSGSMYAVTVHTGETRTSILQLDLDNSANSVRLVSFEEEDTLFSLAESAGNIAATIGGEGAAIYAAAGIEQLERTPGFPLKLIDGGSWLISLDRDGNICWHDNSNGKLLAVFRLRPDGWALQTESGIISGGY